MSWIDSFFKVTPDRLSQLNVDNEYFIEITNQPSMRNPLPS